MDIPFLYVDVAHPTWLFYAALLVLAVFFRFSRLLSVRNLDVSLVLALSAALVLNDNWTPNSTEVGSKVPSASQVDLSQWSTVVLLSLSVLLIVRLIFDESLTRRPRLGQNLNRAGLAFLCVPAFAILMSSVFMGEPSGGNVDAVESGQALLHRQAIGESEDEAEQEQPAPTETLIAAGASAVAQLSGRIDEASVSADSKSTPMEQTIACVLIFIAHTIIILGFLYIGSRHFNSLQLGIAMSCLYLLLPCTTFKVHELSHVLPAGVSNLGGRLLSPACDCRGCCLVWRVGLCFLPSFCFHCGPYSTGDVGSVRFGVSLAAVAAVALFTVAMTSSNADSFFNRLVLTTNWTFYGLFTDQFSVSSLGMGQIFVRITLAATFFVMLTAMTVVPRRRNLENLLANSTALVVTAQLWYPEDIGTYVLWYLPLLLLVMFRPRLDRFTPPKMKGGNSEARTKPPATSTGGSLSRVTLYH